MADVEYSADVRASIDGLNEAVLYALKKFKDSPEAKQPEAQNDVGCKLRHMNRLIGQIHHSLFPGTAEVRCKLCNAVCRVELAFWGGVCYDCVGKG